MSVINGPKNHLDVGYNNKNNNQNEQQQALPVANMPEEAERAATKIQAGFKGYKTRKELEGKLGGQQGAPQAGANSENEALQDITSSEGGLKWGDLRGGGERRLSRRQVELKYYQWALIRATDRPPNQEGQVVQDEPLAKAGAHSIETITTIANLHFK